MMLIFQYLLDGILEWIERVDEFFEYRNFPETMQAKLVESKFKDRALVWWKQLKDYRKYNGKEKIRTWRKMRKRNNIVVCAHLL